MANPMAQFEIQRLAEFSLGGVDASFTNASAWMLVTLVAIWAFMALGMRQAALVPGRWQAAVEGIHDFVLGIAEQNIGKEGRKFFPFLFALFMFILVANVAGLLPYAFTTTSHIAVTFALAALVFLVVLAVGFARHGLKFFSLFLPEGTPGFAVPLVVVIEIISFLSRPLTLSIRLFANMTAGHVLLKVFAGFIISLGLAGGALTALAILPLIMNVALTGLELLIAVIQAYVFALLTSIYLHDAVHLH